MQTRLTICYLLVIAALSSTMGCPKPAGTSAAGTPVPFEELGDAATSSWPVGDTPEALSFSEKDILRSAADADQARITVRPPFDWSRKNVLFIREFVPLHMHCYTDFRIVTVTRYPDRLVVRTAIGGLDKVGMGGCARMFYAVAIPATDLPAVFDPYSDAEANAPRPSP